MAASNILETFFILFKSNTDEVKKGSEEAKRASGDLEDSLTRTEAAGVAMGDHLMETFGALAAGIAAAFTVERALAFTGEVAELNAELGLTSRRLGIGVADLYAWGQAAEETGGNLGGIVGFFDFLNKGLADIAVKGTSRLKPFFDELKIKADDGHKHAKPLLEVVGQLADKFSAMSAQERAAYGEKFGMDAGTVLMFAQNRRAIDDLIKSQKEMGTVTEEDTEIAHKYGRSIEELGDRARLTATDFGSAVLPTLTEFFNWVGKIVDYLRGHKELVEGFFMGVAGVITALYLPAAIEAAIATWAFLAPILAIVAPILAVAAAFAFLYDDVQNFLAGNKSVIGELSQTWPVIGETVRAAIEGAGDVWNWFVDLLKGGASVVSGIAQLVVAVWGRVTGAFDGFHTKIAEAFPFWTKAFRALGDLIGWVAGMVGHLVAAFAKLGFGALVAIPKALANFGADSAKLAGVVAGKQDYAHAFPTKGAGYYADAFKARDGAATAKSAFAARDGIKAGQQQIKLADSTPLAAQSSHSIGAAGAKNVTNHVNVEAPITVNAAPGMSAEEVGEHVAKHIDKHVRQAINHNDDGVSH